MVRMVKAAKGGDLAHLSPAARTIAVLPDA